MKKTIILLFICLFCCFNTFSQELTTKSKAQTEISLTKTATKTGQMYNNQIVYKSSKGSLFIIKKSAKTGNFYKIYLQNKS